MALPGSARQAGHARIQTQAQPGFRAQPAALQRREHPAGTAELRLRIEPRARALGAAAIRLSRADCASYADIFFNNCYKNGLLPIVLPEATVGRLFDAVAAFPGYELTVDLQRQVVVQPQGEELPFEVEPFRKYCLLGGLDDIGLTLRHKDKIQAYEAERLITKPWLAHVMSS